MENQDKKIKKLTDKAFSRLILTSALGFFVCIVCLCSTTWAWFSESSPSSDNAIKMAGECLLSVTVTHESGGAMVDGGEDIDDVDEVDGDISDATEEAIEGATEGATEEATEGATEEATEEATEGDADGIDTADALGGESTTVTLEDIENGVTLTAGVPYTVTLSLPSGTASGYCLITAGDQTYYTDYIARHEESEPQTLSFELTVGSTQTVVFTPRWGIFLHESDVHDGAMMIP